MRLILLIVFFLNFNTILCQTKATTMYWDSSYSMRSTSIEQSKEHFESYFSINKDVDLNLIFFSNTILKSIKIIIRNGDWSPLIGEIQNVTYDGATSFANLFKEELGIDEYLLFTDSIETLSKIDIQIQKPVKIYCISNDCNKNTDTIKISDADYILNSNFNRTTTSKDIQKDGAYGKVFDELGPISDVTIKNTTSNKTSVSDQNGNFYIEANIGDIIAFSFIGKVSKKIKHKDSNPIQVLLLSSSTNLDEVIVEGENTPEEEIVETGNGKVRKRQLGYAVQTVNADDLNEGQTDIGKSIAGKVPGLQTGNQNDLGQAVIRGFSSFVNSNHPLIIVDGAPVPRSQPGGFNGTTGITEGKQSLGFVDPNNIKDITVLKGLAATNRYGAEGSSGVILITTKSGSGATSSKKKKRRIGTTKTFTGEIGNSQFAKPQYIKTLENEDSAKDAYVSYISLRDIFGSDISFFINVAAYFNKWNSNSTTTQIITNAIELDNTLETNKAVAYTLQELQLHNEAIIIYENIIEKFPDYAQGYRDLAIAYVQAGEIKKAFDIYLNFQNDSNSTVIYDDGIQKNITAEFKNFIALYKAKIDVSKIDSRYKSKKTLYKRIVFEWNKPGAQFDLQIVNPQKRYYTWSHSLLNEPQRLSTEEIEGYTMEEYFINESDKGEWIFNLKLLKENQAKNTYFKITTYTNYGKPNQTHKTKVINLSEIDKNINVLKIRV